VVIFIKAYDFEYDNRSLSSFGFVICKFNSDSIETISNGSVITFNTVSTMRGLKHELTSSEYEDCLTATFQICKNPCISDGENISLEEMRDIMKWLNRKKFHKFKLLDADYLDIYFESSFNVSKIEIGGKIYGFELEMFTNRPFALQEPITKTIKSLQENGTKSITSQSDEEGYIYPEMKITIEADGNLEIYNALENRTMSITNCTKGEVITIDYPMIKSSLSTHKIQNDFNWKFFRIANSSKKRINEITISIPCTIEMKYSPIVKVGI
jgi:hypothetical protein